MALGGNGARTGLMTIISLGMTGLGGTIGLGMDGANGAHGIGIAGRTLQSSWTSSRNKSSLKMYLDSI